MLCVCCVRDVLVHSKTNLNANPEIDFTQKTFSILIKMVFIELENFLKIYILLYILNENIKYIL